jgi:hypothetical protein
VSHVTDVSDFQIFIFVCVKLDPKFGIKTLGMSSGPLNQSPNPNLKTKKNGDSRLQLAGCANGCFALHRKLHEIIITVQPHHHHHGVPRMLLPLLHPLAEGVAASLLSCHPCRAALYCKIAAIDVDGFCLKTRDAEDSMLAAAL